MKRIVIVGAGQAGHQAASSISQLVPDARITLLGAEKGLPYQRPPLSKAFLKGGLADTGVQLCTRAWLAGKLIDYRDDTPVVAIDRTRCEVITAQVDRVPYDHLVLATGARNVRLPSNVRALRRAHILRTLPQAKLLRDRLPHMARALVIGGGFIGLELAACVRQMQLPTTVMERDSRVMARAVSRRISEFFQDLHRRHGVELRLDCVDSESIVAAQPNDEKTLVAVGVGARPNMQLAEEAGLETGNGIVVDGHLLTSDSRISAIGDCANFIDPQGNRVRLESVQNAVDQAKYIARRLAAGTLPPFRETPWFWSEQFGVRLQIAGLHGEADQFIRLGEAESFSELGFRGEELVCVESVNRPVDHIAARQLLTKGIDLRPADAQVSGFTLRDHVNRLAAVAAAT